MHGAPRLVRGHEELARGPLVIHRFGDALVSLVQGGPQELVRPQRLIDPAGEALLHVCRPLAGEVRVRQDGREVAVRGPDLVCYDSGRPYRVVMPEGFRMTELRVTHRLMGITPANARHLTARGWPGTHGCSALLSGLLDGLARHGREAAAGTDLLGGGVVALAAAVVAERMRAVATAEEAGRQQLLLRVQAYIRQQLADPELSPASVARHHRISLRYLQRLFQEHGLSPARWIREERLARCRAELCDPGLRHLPVAVIGERSGFTATSHLSRLFRDRYGVTPRDWRKESTAA